MSGEDTPVPNQRDSILDSEDNQIMEHKPSVGFMLKLPEANPLMLPSKPQDYKPRILISDYKYMELPNVLNSNMETEFQEPPAPIAVEEPEEVPVEPPPQVEVIDPTATVAAGTVAPALPKVSKKCQLSLYEKYELSKQYTKVYSRYKEQKSVDEKTKNFAGMCMNLNCIVDFNPSKFITFDSHRTNEKDYYEKQYDLHKIIQLEKLAEFARHQEEVSFHSRFECGNLLSVYTKAPNKEYDLILQNDTNSKGYAQWFFFEVRNYTFKDLTVTFNISNLTKGGSLFNQGMRPAVFSLKEHEATQCGWMRQGKNITVTKNTTTKEQTTGQYYDTLSFQYTFEHEVDEVYFAMNIPYSYTKMIQHLQTAIPEAKTKQPNLIAKKDTLCYSICNNAVPIISITERTPNAGDTDKEQLRNTQKKTVWIIARQHPGETVSSFKMEGAIDYLLGSTQEAIFLRSIYVFKIIPMMNPDGVIYGNYRCNLAGFDINRQWISPSKILHPCVYHAKKAILQSRDEGMRMDYFIDLHGHSKKMNTFIYACRREDDYISCRLFPAIFSRISEKFSFKDCTFQLEEYKESAARITVWNEVNRPKELYFQCHNIFTLETSFYGYRTSRRSVHFQMKHLREIGADLIRSIYMSTKGEDKLLYPKISKKEIMERMHGDIQQFIDEKGKRDSGSDSDPEAGEINLEEKLGNMIPLKAAKKLGLIIKQQPNQPQQSSTTAATTANQLNQSQQASNAAILRDKLKKKSPRKVYQSASKNTPQSNSVSGSMYQQVFSAAAYQQNQQDTKNQTIFKNRSISRGGAATAGTSGLTPQRIVFNLSSTPKRADSLSSPQTQSTSSATTKNNNNQAESTPSRFSQNAKTTVSQFPSSSNTNNSVRRSSTISNTNEAYPQQQSHPPPNKHFLEDGDDLKSKGKESKHIASSPSPNDSPQINPVELIASLLKSEASHSLSQFHPTELQSSAFESASSQHFKRRSLRRASSRDESSEQETASVFTNKTLERAIGKKPQMPCNNENASKQQLDDEANFNNNNPPPQLNTTFYSFLSSQEQNRNLKSLTLNHDYSKQQDNKALGRQQNSIKSQSSHLTASSLLDSPIRPRVTFNAAHSQFKPKVQISVPAGQVAIGTQINGDVQDVRTKTSTSHHLPTASLTAKKDQSAINENSVSLTYSTGYYDSHYSEKKPSKNTDLSASFSAAKSTSDNKRTASDKNTEYGLQISAFTPIQLDSKGIQSYNSPQKRNTIQYKRADTYYHNTDLSNIPMTQTSTTSSTTTAPPPPLQSTPQAASAQKPSTQQSIRTAQPRLFPMNNNDVEYQAAFIPQRAYSLYHPQTKRVPSQISVRQGNNDDSIIPRNIKTAAQKERHQVTNSVKVAQVNLNYNMHHLQANLPYLESKVKGFVRDRNSKIKSSFDDGLDKSAVLSSSSYTKHNQQRTNSAAVSSKPNRFHQSQFQSLLD